MIFVLTRSIMGGHHNPMLLQLSIQGARKDPKSLCSLVFVPPGLLYHLQDKVLLGVS